MSNESTWIDTNAIPACDPDGNSESSAAERGAAQEVAPGKIAGVEHSHMPPRADGTELLQWAVGLYRCSGDGPMDQSSSHRHLRETIYSPGVGGGDPCVRPSNFSIPIRTEFRELKRAGHGLQRSTRLRNCTCTVIPRLTPPADICIIGSHCGNHSCHHGVTRSIPSRLMGCIQSCRTVTTVQTYLTCSGVYQRSQLL